MDIPVHFPQSICLQEQQKLESNLDLTFDKAVVRQAVGELIADMIADITEIERLEVSVAHGMEKYEGWSSSRCRTVKYGRLRRRLQEVSILSFSCPQKFMSYYSVLSLLSIPIL